MLRKFKKPLIASTAIASLVFSASICASAAQIDCLSVADNTIYAEVTAENARLYAVDRTGGLLNDVFFADIASNGSVQLPLGDASEYELYLWDKESLAPLSATYSLKNGVAYPEGSETPVPAYEFSSYAFNQEDSVMVVSSISEAEITGFKAGVETTYPLAEEVTVVGLSESLEEVVPGSVVLVAVNKQGECAAVELLASLGWPIDEEGFKADYGVYTPSDGSTKYKNIVDIMFSKWQSKITVRTKGGTAYLLDPDISCYRVGIATGDGEPIISVSSPALSQAFESTSEYSNYLYLRMDTEKSRTFNGVTYDGVITQCVVYCVPKNYDFSKGDDEYTGIFSLEPVVIIK